MRTSAGLLVALALLFASGQVRAEDTPSQGARADARSLPFTAILGLEASIVGLSFGPRAELLWRFGPPGSISHLRTTVGILPGPELVFVPIGIGYRAVFRVGKTVQPFAGAAYEAHFFLTDGPAYAQWAAIALEGGVAFAVIDRFLLGLGTSLDWTVVGERGPGLQARIFAGYRF